MGRGVATSSGGIDTVTSVSVDKSVEGRILKKRTPFLPSLVLLAGIGFMCCEQFTCPDLVDSDYALEFILRGGFGGICSTLVLNKDGTVEASNRTHLESGSTIWPVVSDSIPLPIREEWQHRLNDVGFFCLDDDYPPATVIVDGFLYELTIESQGITKTVSAADMGGHPDKLHKLFWDLFYDLYLPVYQDSATVGTSLIQQKYMIQTWPFTEQASLANNVHTECLFSEIDSTGEIARYLNGLYYPDGECDQEANYLHLEGDYLYRFTMIVNEGFKINSAHLIRYWPEEFNIALSDIPVEGLAIRNELYKQVEALLIEPLYLNSIFIEALVTEDMVAYYVALVNGVNVDWP